MMIIGFLFVIIYIVQAIYWQWKENYEKAILNVIWVNICISVLIYSNLGVG